MEFRELHENYDDEQMQELAEALLSFVGLQKQLQDPEDPVPKGNLVNMIRVNSTILKLPPWNLEVDYLWQICQELDQYEDSILNWLRDMP